MPARWSLVPILTFALACGAPQAAFAGAAQAGAPQPAAISFPIAVSHSGDDAAGVAFVGSVKSYLRQSGRYPLVEPEGDAELTLHVSTIDPSGTGRGAASVAAWSLLVTKRNGAYLSGGVRSFTAGRADESARDLVLALDRLAMTHRQELPGSGENKDAERAWNAAVEEAAQGIRSSARQKLFLQHMDLQRQVFQLSGSLLPTGTNLEGLAASLASEYDDAAPTSYAAELAACRAELAALKKAGRGRSQ